MGLVDVETLATLNNLGLQVTGFSHKSSKMANQSSFLNQDCIDESTDAHISL
jgi:hypothetical protein